MTYPYVQSPDKLKEFLLKLPTIGQPDVFDTSKLSALGYTSSNDKAMLGAVKSLGIIENKRGGGPTDLWAGLRSDFGSTMATASRNAYADLYAIYPDAHQKDQEALRSFFAANTTVGSGAVSKMVSTFKAIVSLADFDSIVPDDADADAEKPQVDPKPINKVTKANERPSVAQYASGPNVNLNIQLQLPSDASGEVYEKFFSAMKKHLYPES